MYRNRKLLDEAAKHSCQGCGADDNTIVAAHSNQGMHGKGLGLKAHDCFIAFLCARCHEFVDRRKADQELRIDFWVDAHCRSIHLFYHLLNDEGRALLLKGRA